MSEGKISKLIKYRQDKDFAIFSELLDISEELKKKIESTLDIEIDPEEIRGLKGDFVAGPKRDMGPPGPKGDKGDSIVGPAGPKGDKGDSIVGPPGKDGESIVGPKGDKGDSIVGPRGEIGPIGPAPKHRWAGTYLQFENPDGTWGSSVNLKGPEGDAGKKVLHRGGGTESALTTLASLILATASVIDDTNVDFVFTSEPSLLVINGASYGKTGGAITWSWAGSTATLSIPIGLGGSIFGLK